nr:MAG TPA: hypothetical protein [Caudoviricetes sp.]
MKYPGNRAAARLPGCFAVSGKSVITEGLPMQQC